jgi:23S rRNA pseudouridine2457 synthase
MTSIAFFKPYNVLTKFTDAENRPTLADYIPLPDVYPAGRLDKNSEGLLLLTDDGELASHITHPRYKLPKTYWCQVERTPGDDALRALRNGLMIRGRPTKPAQARLFDAPPDLPERSKPIRYRKTVPTAWLELIITEGRNRQVRRMTAAVGHPTLRLVRYAVGPVTIAGLAPGDWRHLSADEVNSLRIG